MKLNFYKFMVLSLSVLLWSYVDFIKAVESVACEGGSISDSSHEVCLTGGKQKTIVNNASTISRTLAKLSFNGNNSQNNSGIRYEMVSLTYAYSNNNSYHVEFKNTTSNVVIIDIYAASFSVIIQHQNPTFSSCINVTMTFCSNSKVPKIHLNVSDVNLIDKTNVSVYVSGQKGSLSTCFFAGTTVSVPVVPTESNSNVSAGIISINKRKIHPYLCDTCLKNQCDFEVNCTTSYPGSKNVSNATTVLQTNVFFPHINISSVKSGTTNVVLSGTVQNYVCRPSRIVLAFPNRTISFNMSNNSFEFNISNLKSCTRYNVSIRLFSNSNLLSNNKTYFDFVTLPTVSNLDFMINYVATNAGTSRYNFTIIYLDDCKFAPIRKMLNISCLSKGDLPCPSRTVIIDNKSSIVEVSAGMTYQAVLSLHNGYSKPKIFTTPYGIPQGPPLSLTSHRINQTAIRLKWDLPSPNLRFGNITTFLLASIHRNVIVKNRREFVFDFLDKCDEISVNISACQTVDSVFQCGVNANLTTNNCQLKPTGLKFFPGTDSIECSWADACTSQYSVVDISCECSSGFFSTSVSLNKTGYVIKDLLPGTANKIRICFKSDERKTGWLEVIQVTKNMTTTIAPRQDDKPAVSAGVKAAIIVTAIFVVFTSFFLWVYCQIRKHRQRDSSMDTSKESHSQQIPPSRRVSSVLQGKINLAFENDLINSNVTYGYFPLQYEVDDFYKPVAVEDFSRYVRMIKSDNTLSKQFASLDNGGKYERVCGTDAVNAGRNRHDDIVPYDHSRVILDTDKKSTDYINASLISGYVRREAYIATQGPLPSTFNDFWRMIWQYETKAVVILGQRIENGIIKFPLYWPTANNVAVKYGKLTAKMKSFEKFVGYAVTSLQLYKKPSSGIRELKLFHFAAWNDRKVPNNTEEILSFREAINRWRGDHKSPIVVHCSAGVGRTGAFIAIDAIIENISRAQLIDVYNYVNYMRTRRVCIVQTEDQFQFVYDAVLAYLERLSSSVDVSKSNIDEVITMMERLVPRSNVNGYTKYFNKIQEYAENLPQKSKLESYKTEHAHKNRYPDKTPLDTYRVKILATGLTLSETYINATQVSNHLISTQAPLKSTCKDFWLMVYDSGIKNIVMLNAIEEDGESVPSYFNNDTITFSPLSITVLSETYPVDSVIKREMRIRHVETDDEHDVIHYQVLNWPSHGLPTSLKSVTYIANEMQRCNATEPTVVHCNDGFERSGCMLACSMCVEQLDENDHVIVDHVVQRLKERNCLFISCVDQYEFIFKFLKQYFNIRYNGVTYL